MVRTVGLAPARVTVSASGQGTSNLCETPRQRVAGETSEAPKEEASS